MIQRGYFGHNNPEGNGPVARATAAGYYTTFVGENLSARAPLTLPAAAAALHTNLFLSAEHRVNSLLGDYREVGLGLQYGSIKFTSGQVQVGSIVTQLFGGGYPNQVYVTGVAYEDTIDNNVYNAGEGRGGIVVEARDAQGHRFATTTGSSGGYSLRLDPGTYHVFAFSANRSRMLDLGAVDLTGANVKKDVQVEDLNRGFVVTDSIVVSGSGQTWSMSDANVNMVDVCQIDIRGTGDNLLRVDVAKLRAALNNHVVMVMADPGDSIEFDAGWRLESLRVADGSLIRRVRNGTTDLDLMGPSDLTNPIDAFDVNADTNVTSLDALAIVNELAARRYSAAISGVVRSVTSIDLSELKLFDVSADGRITSLDALRVINEMGRRSNLGLGSGEQVISVQWTSMIRAEKERANEDRRAEFVFEDTIAWNESDNDALDWEFDPGSPLGGFDATDAIERDTSILPELADLSMEAWRWAGFLG